jgi:phosphate transport system substrate-binding protein
MSQRNATTFLVLPLLLILGLGSGVLWWFTKHSDNSPLRNQSQLSSSSGSSNTDFTKVQNVPSGLFNYGGSTSWATIRRDVDPVIESAWPQFRLQYTQTNTGAPGSVSGIDMLLKNQLAFSQSSHSLNVEELQQAQAMGVNLKQIPVAIDSIAIAVNHNLNVPGLTLTQLKDIYTGKLTNWNSVGGPNLKITPYSRRPEESGTNEVFTENVIELFTEDILGKQKLGTNVQFIPTTTEALREVVKNPGGIYYASAPEVVSQCEVKSLPLGRQASELIPPYKSPKVPPSQCPQKRNQLNIEVFQSGEYPITRRLFVIVKQNGQIEQQAGIAYANLLLTSQGQELLTKSGFISIADADSSLPID